MNDARFEIRRASRTTIELVSQHWDEPVALEATDLSPEGAFLPSSLVLEVGEPVIACFTLPGLSRELQLFGEVAWVSLPRRATDRGVAGMGVRFLKTRPMERLTVRQALWATPAAGANQGSATHVA